ncbi:MAG: S-layer homology domain-containing protein [Actinomycetota bacterium]
MRKLIATFSLIALAQTWPLAVSAQTPVGDPIDRIVATGWMTPDSRGNFNPEGIVSRAELASILVKTFQLDRRATAQKPNVSVPDVPTSYWGYQAIQIVLKTGTMAGYRDQMFFPNQRVSRAEALAIFAQAYGVFQFPEGTVTDILAQYPDAGEIPTWARKSLATALYEGFVNVDSGTNKINPLKPMTRRDMVYALNQYLNRQERPTAIPRRDNPAPTPEPNSPLPTLGPDDSVPIPVPVPRS